MIGSGIYSLDKAIQGLRPGDNVVWQVHELENYTSFARPFADQSVRDQRKLVYIRFAPHPLILEPREGLETIEVDPEAGFDSFSSGNR